MSHVTRTPLSRSKGQRSTCRGHDILWWPPAQLVLAYTQTTHFSWFFYLSVKHSMLRAQYAMMLLVFLSCIVGKTSHVGMTRGVLEWLLLSTIPPIPVKSFPFSFPSKYCWDYQQLRNVCIDMHSERIHYEVLLVVNLFACSSADSSLFSTYIFTGQQNIIYCSHCRTASWVAIYIQFNTVFSVTGMFCHSHSYWIILYVAILGIKTTSFSTSKQVKLYSFLVYHVSQSMMHSRPPWL